MTRSIPKHMNMPNHLWGEAVRHATYLINRVATRSLDGKTPYEALKGRKPNLSLVKIFGSVCYARTETVGRTKLDDRSKVLVHLGTEPGSKAYGLFDPQSKRVVVSRDVVFEEETKWSWNDKAITKELDSGELEFNMKGFIYGNNEVGSTSEVSEDGEANDNSCS